MGSRFPFFERKNDNLVPKSASDLVPELPDFDDAEAIAAHLKSGKPLFRD